MLFVVAVFAKIDEVVWVKRDVNVAYVIRSQRNLMMNLFPYRAALLTFAIARRYLLLSGD